MMKLITLVALALMMTTTASAAIVCKKEGRFWYPQNDKAIKIAKALGVKTCNGKRFKSVVKQLGEKSNVVASSKKNSVEDVLKMFK